MNRESKKKRPLNQERRLKQTLEREPDKTRGMPVPPSRGHKDKRRDKRQDTKRKMREHTSMDRNYIASELVTAAKEMTASIPTLRRFMLKGYQLFWVIDLPPRVVLDEYVDIEKQMNKLARDEISGIYRGYGAQWRMERNEMLMIDSRRKIAYISSKVLENDTAAQQGAEDYGFKPVSNIS